MNLGKKIVSVVAGVALVAGAGAIAAAPAQAKPKTKGTTVISFDKSLAPVVAGIVAVAPAKISGTRLSFPVSKVAVNAVEHTGAIKIGPTEVSNPIIIIGEMNTASITVTSAAGSIELFTVKHFKKTVNKKTKQQIWQGDLHLTTNQIVVDILNQSAGAAVFTPDMGLGQIRTTINMK
jgi:hypothetical protein